MNKTIKILAVIMMAFAFAGQADAQLKNVLSKAKDAAVKAAGSNATVAAVLDNVVGSNKISASSLVGTWQYSQPAVAFESENALAKIGGTAASAKIETKMQTYFSKVGIIKGKFSITFKSDGTFSTTIKGKQISGVYTVNGATVTFAKSATAKTKITANAKLGTTLQLTFKADKLLTFVQQFATLAGSSTSNLSAITDLAKNYSGMQVGMRFAK